jgi:hypothetical protein
VDACTVTALDAITAFAFPNPNFSSQSRRFFQVRMPVELPLRTDHSAYFGPAKFYLSQPFQPSTRVTVRFSSSVLGGFISRYSAFLSFLCTRCTTLSGIRSVV